MITLESVKVIGTFLLQNIWKTYEVLKRFILWREPSLEHAYNLMTTTILMVDILAPYYLSRRFNINIKWGVLTTLWWKGLKG